MCRPSLQLGRSEPDASTPQIPYSQSMQPIRRIAISTGGGDAPGLNAVIRAATLAARNRGWDVVGIRDGFNGLLFPERLRRRRLDRALTRESVRGIVHLGGTIIGTTNRGNPTAYPVQQADGTWIEVDRTDELLGCFDERRHRRARSRSAATAR